MRDFSVEAKESTFEVADEQHVRRTDSPIHLDPFMDQEQRHQKLEQEIALRAKELASLEEQLQQRLASLQSMEQELKTKEHAIETSLHAYSISDMEGRITFANESFLRMWDYASQDLVLGMGPSELWSSPEQGLAVLSELKRFGYWQGVLIGKRRNGDTFYVESSARLICDAEESPISVMASFLDITERVKVEQALRSNEASFRAITENTGAGMVVHLGGLQVFANHRASEILGYHHQDLLDLDFISLVVPEKRQQMLAYFRDCLGTGKAEGPHELEVVAKENQRIPLEVTCSRTMWHGQPGVLIVFTDITKRRDAYNALLHSEARLEEAQRIARLGNWEWDIRNKKLFWSEQILRILEQFPQVEGDAYEAFLGFVHPDDKREVLQAIYDSFEHDSLYAVEHRILQPSGEVRYVFSQGQVFRNAEGTPARMMGTMQDITEQKLNEIQMKKLSSALEQAADMVFIMDREGIIEYVNPAFEEITGYCKEDVLGSSPSMFNSGKQGEEFYHELLWETIKAGEPFRDTVVSQKKDGELYHEERTITPIRNDDGDITHFVAVGKDISERIDIQERLMHMAHHDALTNLPNRTMFMEHLQQSLNYASSQSWQIAVMFLDLDRFKLINDIMGHAAGDQLLKQLAQRLEGCLRGDDMVSRLGGDEFAILLQGVASSRDVTMIAEKLLEALQRPFWISNRDYIVTSSIGISMFPQDGGDANTLLCQADIAMYQAKEMGRNNFQFYNEELGTDATARVDVEQSLRSALERDEFRMYYQPKVNVRTGKVVGAEALLRWEHPTRGMVSPGEFVPVLEETGLIIPVGNWIVETVCQRLSELMQRGHSDITIAVNLAPKQCYEAGFFDTFVGLLKQYRVHPSSIEVEITESTLMREADESNHLFHKLHDLGVKISIDDFGTGYSNLGYLKRFPIDALKIDRSFVIDIPKNKDDAELAGAIISMAHKLHLKVIAEGVETMEQLNFIKENGCSLVQGYLFGKPMPAEEFYDYLLSF